MKELTLEIDAKLSSSITDEQFEKEMESVGVDSPKEYVELMESEMEKALRLEFLEDEIEEIEVLGTVLNIDREDSEKVVA